MAARRLPVRTALILAVLAAACSPQRRAGASAPDDDWGRPVELRAPARRIVSLSPSTTEIVFALGIGGRLVGRTRWCDFPSAALGVPDLGDGLAPNVEAVAAVRPDLVLLYASEANRGAAERLAALGVAVAAVRVDRVEDLRRATRLIALLGGVPAAADSLVRAFDSALAAASRPRAGRAPLRVYVDVWGEPPMTVGRGSYLDEVLHAAGAANVFGDLAASSATVSLEAIVARDPDVVLLLAGDTLAPPEVSGRAGWRAVRAVRDGRVVVVDGGLYGRPSPRMPVAARDLAARLAALVVSR